MSHNMQVVDLIHGREWQNDAAREIQQKYGRSEHAITALTSTGDLEGHKGCVNAINFNPNGDLIVSGSDDETVKIWNTHTRECLTTLTGHTTNVFATNFFPHKSDNEVISGGNDSDLRHYDISNGVCTVLTYHTKKVLRISINAQAPDTFMSCSADGTVCMFDIRQKYQNSRVETAGQEVGDRVRVLPQVYGGGWVRSGRQVNDSAPLLLDFTEFFPSQWGATLYSVDIHPHDGHSFIVASNDGNTRLFDLRFIRDKSPASYVNIYRNIDIDVPPDCEATGAVFNRSGTEIVVTSLNHQIHTFDVARNFEKEYRLDYMSVRTPSERALGREYARRKPQRRLLPKPEHEQSGELPGSAVALVGIARYLTERGFLQSDPRPPTVSTANMEPQAMAAFLMDEDAPLDPEAARAAVQADMRSGGVQAQAESDSDEEIQEETLPEIGQTFSRQFTGHISRDTIKACNFCGPNSEYVISGSDNGLIFIWDKETSRLVTTLKGHHGAVNCVVPHPHYPLIASSGIDHVVKIWEPSRQEPYETREVEEDMRPPPCIQQ